VNADGRPDVGRWARAHAFAPSDDQLSGTTPLLRLGELDTTDDAYRGEVDGRDAWLAEYSIGSPRATAGLGDLGLTSVSFTMFVVRVDASEWPRLTVHPAAYSDHDLFRRLRGADHRVQTVSPEFDAHYRVITSAVVTDQQISGLFSAELVAWWLAQHPEICLDIEQHEREGGFLSLARLGLDLDDGSLDQLLSQTRRVLEATATP
jgi:hypothetical protein